MKIAVFLFMALLFAPALAIAETFQVEYTTYGDSPKMRQETVYRKGLAGLRQAFQARIYVDGTNELREASFLQKNGKWATYGDSNLPAPLKEQVEFVNASSNKTQIYGEHPKRVSDNSVAPGGAGDPVLLEVPKDFVAKKETFLKCESSQPGFVTCDGVLYKKVEDGPIAGTTKALKKSSGEEAPIEARKRALPAL